MTLYTYSVVRTNPMPPFADGVPYVAAVVDLEEGPRLTTNILDCEPEDVEVGMRVEAVFEDLGPESLVQFRPRSQGA